MSTSKFKVLRTCEFCGKEFYAQKVSTRYCSKRCNELAYKQRRRQRQIIEAEARVLQKRNNFEIQKNIVVFFCFSGFFFRFSLLSCDY